MAGVEVWQAVVPHRAVLAGEEMWRTVQRVQTAPHGVQEPAVALYKPRSTAASAAKANECMWRCEQVHMQISLQSSMDPDTRRRPAGCNEYAEKTK